MSCRSYILALFAAFSCSLMALPVLNIEQDSVVVGEIKAGEEVSRTISVANSGDDTLVINKVRACCGSVAEVSPRTLEAGGKAELKVKLSPRYKAGEFRKTVTLYTNDPSNRIKVIDFTGTVAEFEAKIGNCSLANSAKPQRGMLMERF